MEGKWEGSETSERKTDEKTKGKDKWKIGKIEDRWKEGSQSQRERQKATEQGKAEGNAG